MLKGSLNVDKSQAWIYGVLKISERYSITSLELLCKHYNTSMYRKGMVSNFCQKAR
jgi:hypothetical protein